MIASGNAPIDDIVGSARDLAVTPMSGEVSRWASRLVGYAALAATCVALVKVLM